MALNANNANDATASPTLRDDSLAIELVAEGLELPTSMRFLDANNILVLQKDDGQVRLISNGKLQTEPVLQVDVGSRVEQGLLGIAVFEQEVFLYFTELADNNTTRNRVYKYDWDGEKLVGGRLILDLPGEPGPYHNGGKIAIGLDGYLYAVIGDVNAGGGMLDNQIPGRPPDNKSVILRVDRQTGMPAHDNPFQQGDLQKYYAYGIRNSFGIDFDPVLQALWMTENGPDKYDEINFVRPGFNSGWHKVTGPISRTNVTESDLNIFDGASYGDPAFSWHVPVGVTDIEFFDSPNLGAKYENNIFVGDINYGTLYFFEVNQNRDGLEFSDPRLSDLVADPVDEGEPESSSLVIGQGFGRITDIETGPDGYLYVLTYEDGKLYRIKQA